MLQGMIFVASVRSDIFNSVYPFPMTWNDPQLEAPLKAFARPEPRNPLFCAPRSYAVTMNGTKRYYSIRRAVPHPWETPHTGDSRGPQQAQEARKDAGQDLSSIRAAD
jgi:hypothetical protein